MRKPGVITIRLTKKQCKDLAPLVEKVRRSRWGTTAIFAQLAPDPGFEFAQVKWLNAETTKRVHAALCPPRQRRVRDEHNQL